ncbi:MAG TPA: hypothetical protein VEX41_06995 [Candidatus Eisenbacteria bacterium]|nr:hypothetical protein [Candidatus Eisenbacteria bacterium]
MTSTRTLPPARAILVIGALIASLGACGPAGTGASTLSPAPTSSPAPSAGPIDGTYTAVFTGNDPKEISEGTGGHQIPVGTWKIVIEGTAFTFFNPDSPQDGFPLGPGVYLAGDQVQLAPDAACPNQEGTPSSGTYHYVVDGTSLTFTLVGTDTCADRTAALIAHPWQKQSP